MRQHTTARAGRPPRGDAFALSAAGKHMLRAIRSSVDDEGVFQRSNAEAAALASVSEAEAARALSELGHRGFIKLRRRPQGDAR